MSTGAAQAYGILRNYEEFRLQFADRIHEHLFNGGALYVNPVSPTYDPNNPQNNVPAARMAELAARVYEAMPAESARWGDQHVSFPRTRDVDWQNSLNYMLGTYFRDRHNIVLNQWKAASLYPTAAAPEFQVNGVRQHGGSLAAGALLGLQNSNTGTPGTIYYTTDGSDPRLVGGAVNSSIAQVFSGSIPLSATTQIKARILRNGEWSALTAATFEPAPVVVSADFNGDTIVDGSDFLAWQRGFGIGTPSAQGDADGDHDVDHDDLAVWKSQFGQTITSTPSAVMSVSAPNDASPAFVADAFATSSSDELAADAAATAESESSATDFRRVTAILQSRASISHLATFASHQSARHVARDLAFHDAWIDQTTQRPHESNPQAKPRRAVFTSMEVAEEAKSTDDDAWLEALGDFMLV